MVFEHNVRINNEMFYAQEVTMPKLFKKRSGIEVPIEEGPSKWYMSPPKQRQFKMTLKLKGPHSKSLDRIRPLFDKVVPFTSTYMGTFQALLEEDGAIEDGTPNMLIVHINVQEVS